MVTEKKEYTLLCKNVRDRVLLSHNFTPVEDIVEWHIVCELAALRALIFHVRTSISSGA